MHNHDNFSDCGCGCSRRDLFAAGAGAAAAGMVLGPLAGQAKGAETPEAPEKRPAVVKAFFVYPPSKQFADNPNGWWSWPGNSFDAEGRQKKYTAELGRIAKKLGMKIDVRRAPVATAAEADKIARQIQSDRPDGVLVVMFYNRSLNVCEKLLKAAAAKDIPAVFYIALGVKHGSINQFNRPGLYFIQSLDNIDAIEYGMRMINARVVMAQSRLLSITEAPKPREGVEKFLGVTVRVIPFGRYAEVFKKLEIDDATRKWLASLARGAREVRGVGEAAMENAARAHLALKKLLAENNADGLTMNCLRRGMLKPCVSFSVLNSQLIPAACENDFAAMYGQMLGQLLTGRGGFQHNPAFETEKNHYYGSHCTCPAKLYGPNGEDLPYMLRRFAHTNEGSCAIQVFWKAGDPVTMIHYYAGKQPALDVYAGKVVVSHQMPPVGGCTTNVEIELTDRADARMVRGHHNVLFCGDFARRFRLFANLFKMRLADTGYRKT